MKLYLRKKKGLDLTNIVSHKKLDCLLKSKQDVFIFKTTQLLEACVSYEAEGSVHKNLKAKGRSQKIPGTKDFSLTLIP